MKELHCLDVGFDCEGVIRGKTEDEVLRQAGQHAAKEHGLTGLDDATVQQIRSKTRAA